MKLNARLNQAEKVQEAYDRFDALRERDQPFDWGDAQNVHQWMREVTEWIVLSNVR